MKYYQIAPRLTKIIGLELFVFGTFIGICALINALIVGEISPEIKPFWNFILSAGKIVISMIFIAIWLGAWYYLTKKLIQPEENETEKEEKK